MIEASTEHGEQFVHITNEHWIKLVPPVIVSILLFAISALLFLLAGLSAHHYIWLSYTTFIAAMMLLLFSHHWLFMVLLGQTLNRIIVTNRRIFRMQFSLIFREDILEISFNKMKTVDVVKNGIIQNLLHYGTIVFESKLVSIPFIKHPNRMAQVIQKAMHQE